MAAGSTRSAERWLLSCMTMFLIVSFSACGREPDEAQTSAVPADTPPPPVLLAPRTALDMVPANGVVASADLVAVDTLATNAYVHAEDVVVLPENGALVVTVEDVSVPVGGSTFRFGRSWASVEGAGAGGRPFGPGWTHSFARSGTPPTSVVVGDRRVTLEWRGKRLVSARCAGQTLLRLEHDESGRVTRLRGPDGVETKFLYDARGRLVRETRPGNVVIEYDYDANELLTGMRRGGESYVAIDYDGDWRVARVQGPGDRASALRYSVAPPMTWTTLTKATGDSMRWQFDTATRRVTTKDFGGGTSVKRYDEAGRLLEYTNATGEALRLVWNTAGRLIRLVLADGSTRHLDYDGWGRLIEARHHDRGVALSYDEEGRLRLFTDERGEAHWYTYEDGQMKVTGPGGTVQRYERDALGRVVAVDDGRESRESRKLDAAGRVTEYRDATGATTRLSWDAAGRLVKLTDALGRDRVWTWDPSGRLSGYTDEAGRAYRFLYGEGNNLQRIERTDAATKARSVSFEHNAEGRVIATKGPEGTTRFRYDGMGRPVEITAPDLLVTQVKWDAVGRRSQVKTAGRVVYAATWDEAGRPGVEKGPNGAVRMYSYDSRGRVIGVADPAPALTVTYDRYGEIATLATPEHTRTFHRDQHGRVVEVRDQPGGRARFAWGEDGRLSLAEAGGEVAKYRWDAAGRLARYEIFGGDTYDFEYDALGQLAKLVSAARGEHRYERDALGRLVGYEAPAAGLRTEYSYDAVGRLAEVATGAQQRMKYGYDTVGNLVSISDAFGRTTRFTWSQGAQPSARFDPAGGNEVYAYDGQGNLVGVQHSSGASELFVYDGKGRLRLWTVDGRVARELAYDDTGDVARVRVPGGGVELEYDAKGLPKTRRILPAGDTLAWEHDDRGAVTAVHLPGDSEIRYERDAQGRPTLIHGPASAQVRFAYDEHGRCEGLRLGDAVSVTYARTPEGRISEISATRTDGTPLLQLHHEYDAAGRIRSTVRDGQNVVYRYDGAGRLAEARDMAGNLRTYAYDGAGNLVFAADGLYQHGERNEVVASPAGKHTWSPAGYLLRKTAKSGPVELEWDAASRLASVRTARGETVRYAYDHEGNLLTRTSGDASSRWLHDRRNAVARIDGDRLTRVWLNGDGLDELYAVVVDGRPYYYVTDVDGSVLAVVDAAGAVVARHEYAPFGRVARTTGTLADEARFQGRYQDPTTGMIHYRHRWYDPDLYAFIQPDPAPPDLLRPETFNPYAFLDNDPRNQLDPLGLSPFEWEAGKTTMETVCNLFQQGKVQASYAFGRALDGFEYVGAVEKNGWQYDVWNKRIPGTNRVVTVFRDLSQKSEGFYGKPNLTGNLVVRGTDTARTVSSSGAGPAPPSGGLGSRIGQFFQDVKLGVQAYGREITGTVGALGGFMGTLKTSVATLASMPGGTTIIGLAAALSGATGYAIGTGLNRFEIVQKGATGFIGRLLGIDKSQTLQNLLTAESLEGARAKEIRAEKVSQFLSDLKAQGLPLDFTPPGNAAGTVDIGTPAPEREEPAKAQEKAPVTTTPSTPDPPEEPSTQPDEAPTTSAATAEAPEKEDPSEASEAQTESPSATTTSPSRRRERPGTSSTDRDDDEQAATDEGDDEEDDEAEEQDEEDDGEEPDEEEEGDTSVLNRVSAYRVTATMKTEDDASAGGFENIVTCTHTLTFWNVGALAAGYGGATISSRCVASLNGATDEGKRAGSFSGGPNGKFTFPDEDGELEFYLSGGTHASVPGGAFAVSNPSAFADWPANLP